MPALLAVFNGYSDCGGIPQPVQAMPRYAYFLIVLLIVVADRWTKAVVIEHLPYLSSTDITPYLSIVHARNYGGAFGFLSQHGAAAYIFLVFPIIIIAGLVYYLVRYPHTDHGDILSHVHPWQGRWETCTIGCVTGT